MQGGLRPCGPEAMKGGEEVEDLLPVLVLVVVHGGGRGHGGEAVSAARPAILAEVALKSEQFSRLPLARPVDSRLSVV